MHQDSSVPTTTTSTTSTTTTVATPTPPPLVAAIDYLYEEWIVWIALGVVVGYLAPFGEWRAYLVVPLTILLVPTLVASLLLYCHRGGLFACIGKIVGRGANSVFVASSFGVEKIEVPKAGQFFLGLALCNGVFFTGYYVWFNVDLLRFVRAFGEMLLACVNALRDPIALLKSFAGLLRSLAMLETMDALRAEYVLRVTKALEAGKVEALVLVGQITVFLVGIGLAFYWVRNQCCVAGEEEEEKEKKKIR